MSLTQNEIKQLLELETMWLKQHSDAEPWIQNGITKQEDGTYDVIALPNVLDGMLQLQKWMDLKGWAADKDTEIGEEDMAAWKGLKEKVINLIKAGPYTSYMGMELPPDHRTRPKSPSDDILDPDTRYYTQNAKGEPTHRWVDTARSANPDGKGGQKC